MELEQKMKKLERGNKEAFGNTDGCILVRDRTISVIGAGSL